MHGNFCRTLLKELWVGLAGTALLGRSHGNLAGRWREARGVKSFEPTHMVQLRRLARRLRQLVHHDDRRLRDVVAHGIARLEIYYCWLAQLEHFTMEHHWEWVETARPCKDLAKWRESVKQPARKPAGAAPASFFKESHGIGLVRVFSRPTVPSLKSCSDGSQCKCRKRAAAKEKKSDAQSMENLAGWLPQNSSTDGVFWSCSS